MFSAGGDDGDDDPYASMDVTAGLKKQKSKASKKAKEARDAELKKKREELEVSDCEPYVANNPYSPQHTPSLAPNPSPRRH